MSTPTSRDHSRAVLQALFVTFLWSSSWVLIRIGLDDEHLEPLTFAALRYGLAALILIGWVIAGTESRASARSLKTGDVAQIVLLGIVFYAVTQGAQFIAIDNQPAATTSLVLSMTPLFVALLGGWSLKEKSSTTQLVGTVLVVAGAWLYFAGDLGATAAGMTAALIGLGANVVGALLGRNVNRQKSTSPLVVTAMSMAVGAIFLIGTGLAFEGTPNISSPAWLIIIWLAVVNTAWAFTLWNRSLQHLTALESAAINNTMLIQIAVFAWVFLGEAIGLPEAAGILLVSVGILLAQTSLGRRRQLPSQGVVDSAP